MPAENRGSSGEWQKLQATLAENQRLVKKSQTLVSEMEQGFAAVKDLKRKARQQQAQSHAPASPAPTKPRRSILLVEDHPIVSLGIAELINFESDLKVTGMAEERRSAMEQVAILKPDLVILDLCLKERSGLELLKEIKARFPKQRVLILSLHDESVYAPRALRAGACGYVMKEEATETLLRAIRQVLDGEIYLSTAMKTQMLQPAGQRDTPLEPLAALTDREIEIFQLIGQGRSTRAIADLLYLSLKTVETHLTNIKHKLDLKTATELIRMAVETEQNPGHGAHR